MLACEFFQQYLAGFVNEFVGIPLIKKVAGVIFSKEPVVEAAHDESAKRGELVA